MKSTATRPASRQVVRELTLDLPAEAVWKALTDAAELTRWFPLEARVRPGLGGAIWMKWEGMYEAESPIEAWEPGRHLRTVFPLHEPIRLATDYYLEGQQGRTVLRVVTSGFGEGTDWDEWFAGVSTGWDFELRSLKHYLERHRGIERVALSVRAAYGSSTAEAWDRLAGQAAWLSFDQTPVAGSRYRARTRTGEELTGVVEQWLPPRQVVLTVDQYNDGIMRLETERGNAMVLWLATWGVAEHQVRSLERSWQASVEQALG